MKARRRGCIAIPREIFHELDTRELVRLFENFAVIESTYHVHTDTLKIIAVSEQFPVVPEGHLVQSFEVAVDIQGRLVLDPGGWQ